MVDSIKNGTQRAIAGMESGLTQVDSSVNLSNQAREAFTRMSTSSQEVSQVVLNISQAIHVEHDNENALRSHVDTVRRLIEQNNLAMQGVVTSAGRLTSMSNALSQAVARFKL